MTQAWGTGQGGPVSSASTSTSMDADTRRSSCSTTDLETLRREVAELRVTHQQPAPSGQADSAEVARLREQVCAAGQLIRTLQMQLDELNGARGEPPRAEQPPCKQTFTSIEQLCEAACGARAGLVIDLQGRVLALDGSYRARRSPEVENAAKADFYSGRFFNLRLCGEGTTLRNGVLELTDGVCLLIQDARVTLDNVTVTMTSLRASAVWGACVRVNGARCADALLKGVNLQGCSLWVSNGASAALECCVITASSRHGVWASGDGTEAALNDCLVTNCAGHGVLVQSGARATVRGTSIDDNALNGVFCGGRGSAARLEFCSLADNERHAASAFNGALVTLRRCAMTQPDAARDALLSANGASSRCEAERCDLPRAPQLEELAGGAVRVAGRPQRAA